MIGVKDMLNKRSKEKINFIFDLDLQRKSNVEYIKEHFAEIVLGFPQQWVMIGDDLLGYGSRILGSGVELHHLVQNLRVRMGLPNGSVAVFGMNFYDMKTEVSPIMLDIDEETLRTFDFVQVG